MAVVSLTTDVQPACLSEPGQVLQRGGVLAQFIHAVVDGNATAAQFREKFRRWGHLLARVSDRRNALWFRCSSNSQLDLGSAGLRVVHESVQVRPRSLGFFQVQPLSNFPDRKRRVLAQPGSQGELYRMAFLLGGQIVLRPLQARQFLRHDLPGPRLRCLVPRLTRVVLAHLRLHPFEALRGVAAD
jgi:hypothetical protein